MSVRDLVVLGTSSQQPTRRRNHGAYLLRWNGEGLLFDPGEGTQRQFIFADVAPTCVTRIFISHFHGDHCLGLGSMLMRLNLDRVEHPIHCYYPASGKKYFDRLRYSTMYKEHIHVVEHPITKEGALKESEEGFSISAGYLDHGVDNVAYRITEFDTVKYEKEKIRTLGIKGQKMRELIEEGKVTIDGKKVSLEDVSYRRRGDSFAYVVDTRYTPAAEKIAKGASMLLCESTYLDSERHLAEKHKHLTARQAATIAKNADVGQLILTHFSARYLDLGPFEEEAGLIFPRVRAAEDLKKYPFLKWEEIPDFQVHQKI